MPDTRAVAFKIAWEQCDRGHAMAVMTLEPVPECRPCRKLAHAIATALQAERAAAFREAAEIVINLCNVCRGKGWFESSCPDGGDSTYDHYCRTHRVECSWCKQAAAALAAQATEGRG